MVAFPIRRHGWPARRGFFQSPQVGLRPDPFLYIAWLPLDSPLRCSGAALERLDRRFVRDLLTCHPRFLSHYHICDNVSAVVAFFDSPSKQSFIQTKKIQDTAIRTKYMFAYNSIHKKDNPSPLSQFQPPGMFSPALRAPFGLGDIASSSSSKFVTTLSSSSFVRTPPRGN